MTLLRINASATGPVPHGTDGTWQDTALSLATGQGPVVIMTHGFRFSPGDPVHCPHTHILALEDTPCARATSWPRHLGVGTDVSGVAFGWPGRGTIWQAWTQAEAAGAQLAQVIAHIRRIAPHRPVVALAHSLGARVLLQALPRLAPGDLSRFVLLAGAEYAGNARAALDSPAGRVVEVLNITSRENDLFDFLLERLIRPPARGDWAIGQRMPDRARVLTVQLDDLASLGALRNLGFPVAAPERLICHWSAYLRPGVFDLYRAFLTDPEGTALPRLRAALPDAPQPRWSRLWRTRLTPPAPPRGVA